MRFVLDTNVVISALVWGGVPYKLIEAAVGGDLELISSPALLAELRDVLSREHLVLRLAKQWPTVEQAIALYAELAINISPLTTPRVVPGDIDDDHVIAAAVDAAAHALTEAGHSGQVSGCRTDAVLLDGACGISPRDTHAVRRSGLQ